MVIYQTCMYMDHWQQPNLMIYFKISIVHANYANFWATYVLMILHPCIEGKAIMRYNFLV